MYFLAKVCDTQLHCLFTCENLEEKHINLLRINSEITLACNKNGMSHRPNYELWPPLEDLFFETLISNGLGSHGLPQILISRPSPISLAKQFSIYTSKSLGNTY